MNVCLPFVLVGKNGHLKCVHTSSSHLFCLKSYSHFLYYFLCRISLGFLKRPQEGGIWDNGNVVQPPASTPTPPPHPPKSTLSATPPQLVAGADGQLSARELSGSNPRLTGRVHGRPEDHGQRAGVMTVYLEGTWSLESFTPLRSTLDPCESSHRTPGSCNELNYEAEVYLTLR